MMSDLTRGFNFTSALLGIKCEELHICGEPRMLNILKKISIYCKDEFKEIKYERKNKLFVNKNIINLEKDLQEGDTIIGFSKNELFKTSKLIKKNYKTNPSYIYGKLPPEIKLQQTKNFNEKNSNFMVATDAVF